MSLYSLFVCDFSERSLQLFLSNQSLSKELTKGPERRIHYLTRACASIFKVEAEDPLIQMDWDVLQSDWSVSPNVLFPRLPATLNIVRVSSSQRVLESILVATH